MTRSSIKSLMGLELTDRMVEDADRSLNEFLRSVARKKEALCLVEEVKGNPHRVVVVRAPDSKLIRVIT